LQLSGRQPRPPPLQTGINPKILKISPEWRRILIDEFFSISSSNLSFIPPTVSEKIDAKVTNIAFSTWSVQNSATKGIQGMQAVSNLPISAWLLLADLNGGKTTAGCRSKPSANW